MQLRVNLQLTIRRSSNQDEPAYQTRIDDLDAQRFSIAAPTESGMPIVWPVGTLLKGEYFNDSGVFSFVTRVLGRETQPIALVVCQTPEKIERLQRRDYVRLEANLPVDYAALYKGPTSQRQKSQAKDISGGGLLFRSPDDIAVGTRVEVTMVLEGQKIHALGEVVRLVSMETEPEPAYWFGLCFINIEDRDRESVIRYIFNQQRERRRKGLV